MWFHSSPILPWEELAAIPESYATAWSAALRDISAISPGQTLVIRGATSALGQAAINIATEMGVRVIATARNAKRRPALEALGASEVLLEQPELVEASPRAPPEGRRCGARYCRQQHGAGFACNGTAGWPGLRGRTARPWRDDRQVQAGVPDAACRRAFFLVRELVVWNAGISAVGYSRSRPSSIGSPAALTRRSRRGCSASRTSRKHID